MGWTCPPHYFQKLFIGQIDENPERKRLNLYAQALLLLRRPPCWNKHGATRTTSAHARHVTPRHVVRVVSWRDATSGIWAL